jgi:heme/copper-type cytochrome/quinol oxidase subunit 2
VRRLGGTGGLFRPALQSIERPEGSIKDLSVAAAALFALKPKSLLLVAVLAAAMVVSGAYYAQTFISSNSPGNSVQVYIQIVGGVGSNTTDTYAPDNFTVAQGEHVTLVVLNTDDNTHGLVIPQFKVDTGVIPSGNTVRVPFVADQTGTFEFYEPPGYCTGGVGNACNSLQRMTGNMTVIP